MIYLSQVSLDPRPETSHRALNDLYALHKLVYSAFADYPAEVLGRILYRLDTDDRHLTPKLLVQSESMPEWSLVGESITAVRGPKCWEPSFVAGETLRFRLRASPTKKVPYPRGHPKAGHQRIGLLSRREQAEWLERQGSRCGFALEPTPDWFDAFAGEEPRCAVQISSSGHLAGEKFDANSGRRMTLTHLSVDFDGALRVTDADAFAKAVRAGIGTGKGFGFGLLSLARI